MITVRAYTDNDLDLVLDIIKKSDSTDRTKDTFVENEMTAMLAFDGQDLIGIIPFEKRRIVLDQDHSINALWVSAAHVDPDYRGKGIGTKMDLGIRDVFPPEFQTVFVVREDQKSPAYRWYRKLGYHHLTNIIALKYQLDKKFENVDYEVFDQLESFESLGLQLKYCFDNNIGNSGGFPERNKGFWSKKYEYHYYRANYEYRIVTIKVAEKIAAYAFLGKTNARDGIDRFDILEFVAPKDNELKNQLWNAICAEAHKFSLKEIRIQLAENDIDMQWFRALGFTERWRTNLLAKYIDSDKSFTGVDWKFFHVDYI